MRIINVYNDTPKEQECILNRLRHTEGIFTPHPTLLTGDFNLHHPLWSRNDQEAQQDQLTEDIVDWTALQGLSLLNPKGEITHLARCDGERLLVIDLSFANQEATDNDTFKDWAIDTRLALDSDHNAIKFIIDQLSQEIENPLDIKFNLRNVKAEDWIKVMEEELEAHREPLYALRNSPYPNHKQLDTYAETLSNIFQAAMAKTSQPNRKSPNSKPWWDQDLKDAVTRVNAARCEHQNYQSWTGEFNPQIQAKICHSRNYFKQLCLYKKRDWINQTIEDATVEDIWKLPNWSKGVRHYPTPPISQGPNLPKATTLHDKCEALQKELYQPPPELN